MSLTSINSCGFHFNFYLLKYSMTRINVDLNYFKTIFHQSKDLQLNFICLLVDDNIIPYFVYEDTCIHVSEYLRKNKFFFISVSSYSCRIKDFFFNIKFSVTKNYFFFFRPGENYSLFTPWFVRNIINIRHCALFLFKCCQKYAKQKSMTIATISEYEKKIVFVYFVGLINGISVGWNFDLFTGQVK